MTDDGQPETGKRVTFLRRPSHETTRLSRLHWLAIFLVSVTGAIHLYVGWTRGRPSLALAGLGFFGGLALFLAGYRRRLYVVGIGYALIQLVLWAVFNAGEYTTIGYVDKTVQLVLVGILARLLWTDAG